ncbi:MAG: hypothetical protein K2P58_02890 [Hyphomonadaceae bacterium]|nr:hypothetical protein [Hyphomonadaceae bacterium]
MRFVFLAPALLLAACSSMPFPFGSKTTTTTLRAADAATSLAVGERITMTVTAPRREPQSGDDQLILMQLKHADGRTLSFTESNHAPMHVMAQAPGGPLAQIMGLFGEEQPTLYGARPGQHGSAFLCGEQGPAAVGVHRGEDGAVQIVGLREDIAFEQTASGGYEAAPYSPDKVCARLRFRVG